MRQFTNQVRDNVYNHENDLSSAFTFSIWIRDDDTDDWCWNRESAYVACCMHRGGDVRGNYAPATLHRVDDCLAECGVLDWVLGWCVDRSPASCTALKNVDDLDEETATSIVDSAVTDERLTERCSPGYASLPSSELWPECQSDSVYWFKGRAILRTTDGDWLVATPYYWQAPDCVITPEDGPGWLCDASIDAEAWRDAILGPDVMDELGDIDNDKVHDLVETVRWDNEEGIGKLAGCHDSLTECGYPNSKEND